MRSGPWSKNAYMLIYVRENEMKEILRPMAAEDIAPALVSR